MVGKAAYEFVVDGYALLIGCMFAGSFDISVRQYFGTYHDPVDEGKQNVTVKNLNARILFGQLKELLVVGTNLGSG